jgi:bifunctional DNA-binding transcriptional regulator/antitoxin component of YhaV-PrlF toxin-antitoxin module
MRNCCGASPREAREALQLKPGDKLIVRVQGEKVLVLEKPKSYRRAIRGLLKKGYGEGYLREERESWE